MPICPFCGYQIKPKGGNQKKIDGTYVHKRCPGKKSYRRIKKEKTHEQKPTHRISEQH